MGWSDLYIKSIILGTIEAVRSIRWLLKWSRPKVVVAWLKMVAAVEAVRRADTGYASQEEPAGFPDRLDIACKKEERGEGHPKVFHLSGQMDRTAYLPAFSPGSMPRVGEEGGEYRRLSIPVGLWFTPIFGALNLHQFKYHPFSNPFKIPHLLHNIYLD